MDTNVDSHNDLTRYAAAKEKDIDHIRAKLKRNQDKNDAKLKSSFPPKRQLSPEIMKLTGQIQNKLKKPSIFSGESHLQPTDPGYGTPQEGSLTAERGQQAHRDIA